MTLTPSDFETRATALLEGLLETIEGEMDDLVEVDLENAILSIELDDGRQYIINKHAPNTQIWVSSPLSGAHHFDFAEASETWVSSRGGKALIELLEGELGGIKGEAVQLA